MPASGAVREARPASVALLTDAVGHVGGGPGPGGPGGGADVDAGADLAAALDATVADAPPDARDELVHAALRAVLPRTAAWLAARGWSDADAAASIGDVDRKVARYGLRGTGLDWLCAVATGRVVAVGRLQFERGASLPDGTPAWGVHIPETGPLDPGACDESFRRAPDLLRALDPFDAASAWTCRSWILDPGMPDALGSESNLSRFAARFTLLPPGPDDAAEGDESVAKFVFGMPLADARTATPTGRVQRAVLARWRTGAPWYERTATAPL